MVKYPWLKYSKQENGGFCLPCVILSRNRTSRVDPGVLVSSPLINFKKALETVEKHTGKVYHKEAVATMDNFLKVMTNQQEKIYVKFSDTGKQLVATNRRKIQSIVETVILCGRQNIPLCGHRDSGVDVESDTSVAKNNGNFWALLQFRVSAGDNILRDHLASAAKNASYTSLDIQNQVIDMLADHVREKILVKVREAQCFTLITNEVTDCSNKEQLSIVIRYVDQNNYRIHEDFVTFLECDSGISGLALSDKMLDFLRSQQLDPTKLRGQAYDGAGNMSGKANGAAARISSQYLLTLYTHCASHCVNLAVVSSFDEVSVRNMIGLVNRVSAFFSAHPKRHRKLEVAINDTQPESSVHKLKDLCRTRWI